MRAPKMGLGAVVTVALAALVSTRVARATDETLLSCRDAGYLLYDCKLEARTLATAVAFGDRAYDTEYTIHYDFPCDGHDLDVGVRAGLGTKGFTQGATGAVLQVSGPSSLETFDPDPYRTSRLSFRPGCALRVTGVSAAPSATTILAWGDEAKAEARVLELSLRLYLTTKDYTNLAQYGTRVLTDLRDRLDELVLAEPDDAMYLLLRDYVQNELDGKPQRVSPDLLGRAAEAVVAKLRGDLATELAKGQTLLDRFTRWQAQVDRDLQNAVSQVARTLG